MGWAMTALALPFDNLPLAVQILFYIAFLIIVFNLAWTIVLFVLSRKGLRTEPSPDPGSADGFLWAFLVPARNESETIADSVKRLLSVDVRNKLILVIDDGSTDGTAAALDRLGVSTLDVVRRQPPEAGQGKAAALNAGWRRLDRILSSGAWSAWSRDRVIVCVVDADGRLDPATPSTAARVFEDASIGGIQVGVRIYNRARPLAWLQDVEFAIYGLLYQAGRTVVGTAGMGGNGQLNRASALDDIVDEDARGPWRDRLTEDQDLGLRLLRAGWTTASVAGATVDQQGLPGIRRLLRQRTRWAQGNLQAMSHLAGMARLHRPLLVRIDLVAYLLMPAMQAIVGVAFAVSIVLAIVGTAGYWDEQVWWQLLFFFFLGFGGTLLGCVARGARSGFTGILVSLAIMPVYAAYTWLIWPVLGRAALRLAFGRDEWAKTAREPVGTAP
jgi:1,2-diacylglycerol 3-beta-glucosyltransferase